MILLNDKEIEVLTRSMIMINPNVIAKSQLKKVVEWLQDTSMDAQTTIFQVSTEKWQSLLKEIE